MTEPEIAPFARNSQYFFLEPCLSPDGKTIYFLSTIPPDGKNQNPDGHIRISGLPIKRVMEHG